MKIYDLLYSTQLKQAKQNSEIRCVLKCVVPFTIAELGQKCLEAASTLK